MQTPSFSRLFTGVALLPALAGALVPKCPICVAAYLSAAGIGASAAHAVAPGVVGMGKVLLTLALCVLGALLGMRVWRSRVPRGPR